MPFTIISVIKPRIPAETMLKLGLLFGEMIEENIAKGVDIHGDPFAKYSPAYAKKKATKKSFMGDAVNLAWSGSMRQALGVVDYKENMMTLGWDDQESAELAYYHNISGAGRGRVLREFLGITDEQWKDGRLAAILGEGVEFEKGV